MAPGGTAEVEERRIWTIGHSTRTPPALLGLLQGNGIVRVVDVRTYPASRRYPQFDRDSLAHWLPEAGIAYEHLPDLGGRRRPQDVNPHLNAAWRSASFKNYADYATTPAFEQALDNLSRVAEQEPTAFMCSEALPWRCHRSLVATALMARGWEVTHIMCDHNRPHQLGQWGPEPLVVAGRVTYPVDVHAVAFDFPDATIGP
jgi:uncharacterized protein (DUF488 family)